MKNDLTKMTEKQLKGNNAYNSLLGLVIVRQSFCIFNLISLTENPSGFTATKS